MARRRSLRRRMPRAPRNIRSARRSSLSSSSSSSLVSLAEQMCDGEFAHLPTLQTSSADEHAQHLPFFSFLVFHFVIFDLVSLSKQVSQQQSAHSSSTLPLNFCL